MSLINEPLKYGNKFRLGLGTGSLGTTLNYKKSCVLVEKAYEAGFRYFDTAPSYGRGLAESILGDVLWSVRDSVIIVTKAGIPHPRAARGIRLARKLLLPLKTAFPSLWKMGVSRTMSVAVPVSKFSRNDIETSFAESLRRLRTDYVDALLLHEVQTQDWSDDLNSLLFEFRNKGLARAIGTATSVEVSVRLLKLYPETIDWIQVPHYWGAFERNLNSNKHRLVTHQCLTGAWSLLKSEEFCKRIAGKDSYQPLLDALNDPECGPALLISSGLLQNSSGTVLVSTCRSDRVQALSSIAQTYQSNELALQINKLFGNIFGLPPIR